MRGIGSGRGGGVSGEGVPRRVRALRAGVWAVLGVASVLSLLCVVLVLGTLRTDQLIAENRGMATAQVERVMFDRTLIRYETPDGVSHSPENGVLYPDGLDEGQLIRIEYDRTDPELAKVAGRTWLLSLLPVGTTLLVVWLVATPTVWWLRARLHDAGGGGAPPDTAGAARDTADTARTAQDTAGAREAAAAGHVPGAHGGTGD